jgi:hypothetical protein
MSERWAPPEVDEAEQRAYQWAVIRTGFNFIMLTSLVYGSIVYFGLRVLESNGIVGGTLPWPACSLGMLAVTIARMWDRMFFKN